jgi:hypothetical protein
VEQAAVELGQKEIAQEHRAELAEVEELEELHLLLEQQ